MGGGGGLILILLASETEQTWEARHACSGGCSRDHVTRRVLYIGAVRVGPQAVHVRVVRAVRCRYHAVGTWWSDQDTRRLEMETTLDLMLTTPSECLPCPLTTDHLNVCSLPTVHCPESIAHCPLPIVQYPLHAPQFSGPKSRVKVFNNQDISKYFKNQELNHSIKFHPFRRALVSIQRTQ